MDVDVPSTVLLVVSAAAGAVLIRRLQPFPSTCSWCGGQFTADPTSDQAVWVKTMIFLGQSILNVAVTAS